MATRQYDQDPEMKSYQIVESVGGAISNGLRLTIDLTKVTSKNQAMLMLEFLGNHLIENAWAPA